MKDEIEEFKNRNGGFVSYSTKELLAALHIKIDKFEKNFEKNIKKVENKTIKMEALVAIHTIILIGLIWIIITT